MKLIELSQVIDCIDDVRFYVKSPKESKELAGVLQKLGFSLSTSYNPRDFHVAVQTGPNNMIWSSKNIVIKSFDIGAKEFIKYFNERENSILEASSTSTKVVDPHTASNKYLEEAREKLKDEKPGGVKTDRYHDPDFCQAIVKLHEDGYTATQIGKALGVKRHSIGSWLSRNGYRRKQTKTPKLAEYRKSQKTGLS